MTKPVTTPDYGRIAYEKSIEGFARTPAWDELGDGLQAQWRSVAKAVIVAFSSEELRHV